MFSPFERMVAWRYLRARKQEGFVSVIAGFSFTGILLGVATLIIVMAVMNGFRQELLERILGLNGHLNVFGNSGYLQNFDDMASEIEGLEGVELVFPTIERQALLSVSGKTTGVLVRALRHDDFKKKPLLSNSIEDGSLTNFRTDHVAIGHSMAEKLRLKVGDSLTLLSPQGKSSPFGTIPRTKRYVVGLIFNVGMYEYDSGFVFMPLETAQKFFMIQNAVTALEIMVDNPQDVDGIRREINYLVDGRALVTDWRDNNASFFNALQVERNVMFLILTLIILVAAFNIISSMIMLVKDKGKDIAILRTMGASRATMMRIFILTGASIGFIGTTVGAGLGIAFAANIETIRQWLQGLTGTELFSAEIYFLSQLPAVIDWNEVLSVIAMAFTLSFLATLYPAWRASKMDPVEALRYE